MTNENKKSKLGLFDYPEPAADFNNQISEASIDKSAAAYKAQRPDDTELDKQLFIDGLRHEEVLIKKLKKLNRTPIRYQKI